MAPSFPRDSSGPLWGSLARAVVERHLYRCSETMQWAPAFVSLASADQALDLLQEPARLTGLGQIALAGEALGAGTVLR